MTGAHRVCVGTPLLIYHELLLLLFLVLVGQLERRDFLMVQIYMFQTDQTLLENIPFLVQLLHMIVLLLIQVLVMPKAVGHVAMEQMFGLLRVVQHQQL